MSITWYTVVRDTPHAAEIAQRLSARFPSAMFRADTTRYLGCFSVLVGTLGGTSSEALQQWTQFALNAVDLRGRLVT